MHSRVLVGTPVRACIAGGSALRDVGGDSGAGRVDRGSRVFEVHSRVLAGIPVRAE